VKAGLQETSGCSTSAIRVTRLIHTSQGSFRAGLSLEANRPMADYRIYLVCPRCYRSKWVLRRNLTVSLAAILNMCWRFKCPIHGTLFEKPLEASKAARLAGARLETSGNLGRWR
jgi:hypothetical protein